MNPIYSIRLWDKYYEKEQRKARLKKAHWVAVSNKHDGKGFRRLMKLENGCAIYGVWIILLSIASKCPVRGVLADEDGPLTSADISDKTGAPEELTAKALQILSSKGIGWIDTAEESQEMRIPCTSDVHDMTETAATGQDRTGHTDMPASPRRVATVDGFVFEYLKTKLSAKDVAKAGAVLKGRAGWSAHTLGCLLYALDSDPPKQDAIVFAKGCANGKSGSRADVDRQITRAGVMLKSFQKRIDDAAFAGVPT